MDNFLYRGITMAEESFKIRLRFPGGEEFEAQGNQQFVEQQRNYFLTLIGKQKGRSTLSAEPALTRTSAFQGSSDSQPKESPATRNNMPALSILPPAEREKPVISPAPQPAGIESSGTFPALRLWERLLKEDGDIVLLRKKMRLSAPEAALLLLAGTRVLLKKPACAALDLARSLKKSGFSEGRLDRLLAPEIRSGHLTCEGTKRGRSYRLTNEGFAKAFVLAEKLGNENPIL